MALIKHSASQHVIREAVVLDLGDLRRQGDEMVSRAQARATEIIAHAEAERKRLTERAEEEGRSAGREEGFAAGHAEGLTQGRAEGLAEATQTIAALAKGWGDALGAFDRARDAMLTEARGDVLSLAVTIAQKITRRIAAHDPAVVREQLAGAIAMVLRSTRLVIHVHPEDRAEAERALPELLARLRESPHTELVDDGSLTRGSCVVRTDHGAIDASIETQIRRIVETLAPVGGALKSMPERTGGATAGPGPDAEPRSLAEAEANAGDGPAPGVEPGADGGAGAPPDDGAPAP